MNVLWSTGFEDCEGLNTDYEVGGTGCSFVSGHEYGYALQISGSGTGTKYAATLCKDAISDNPTNGIDPLGLSIWIRYDGTFPSTDVTTLIAIQTYSAYAAIASIIWDGSNSRFQLSDKDGTAVAYANMSDTNWHRLQIIFSRGSGVLRFYLDDVLIYDDTQTAPTSTELIIKLGKSVGITSRTNFIWSFDDMIIFEADDTSPLPDCRVYCMMPDGNGTYTSWSNDYTAVDDRPEGGDYIKVSETANAKESVTVDNSDVVDGIIKSVRLTAMAQVTPVPPP